MRTIFVCADDFGYSKSINEAIDICFSKNLIDCASLMVNMPCTADAVHLASKGGYFDKLGIHINLTAGHPLTERIRESKVCNADGEMSISYHQRLVNRIWCDPKTRIAIRCELKAQIDKYLSFGLRLMHIDSHHHVHTDPIILSILFDVLKDYEYDSIRLSRNIGFGGNLVKSIYKSCINKQINVLAARSDSKQVEYFGSLDDYQLAMRNKINGSFEIMVHPSMSNGMIYDRSLFQKELTNELSRILQNK